MKKNMNIVFIALLLFQLIASSFIVSFNSEAEEKAAEHNNTEGIVEETGTNESVSEEIEVESLEEDNDDEEAAENSSEELEEPAGEEETNELTDEMDEADEVTEVEMVTKEAKSKSESRAEVTEEFFDLKISEIKDLDDNAYGESNPLKPNDEFWVNTNWELKDNHPYRGGDTLEFELPNELKPVLDGSYDNDLKDGLGNLVANYTVTADGKVTLTFTDFVEEHSSVKGWLGIQAQLNQAVVEEKDGNVVIGPIQDEGNKTIPLDRTPINKTIEKQGQPNKGYNADEIEWTVTINKNANTLKGVSLEDLLPAGTEYVEGSLKAVKQAATLNGTPVGEATDVSVTPSVQDGKLSIPLGDIDEVYTITYTTKVTDTEAKTFKNNVTFKDAELNDTNADATVTINRGEPLNKGAVKDYNPKTGIIEWYLDINFDQKDLTNVTLADSWAESEAAGKMALVDGTVKFQEMTIDENGNASAVGDPVDPSEIGATLVKEADGFKVTGITTDRAYRVVYQTKVTDRQLEGFRIENTASFNGREKGAGYNVGQYVGVKTAGKVDYDKKTIEWEIKVNMDERQMKDVEIVDTVGPGLTLIEDTVVVKVGNLVKPDIVVESGNPFKITNIGDTNTGITVTYKTTFDADNVPNQKPTNKADVLWKDPNGREFNKELNANTQLNGETVKNSWKNASYNPDTKEITWTIIANYRENAFEDFNITDTPQGNQKLVEDSIRVIEMKVNADGAHVDQGPAANADISYVDNSFKVNLGQTNKAYKVVYKTSVAGLEDLAKEYANKAQVKDGDEVIANIDAKVSVYGDRKYGDKRGKQDGRRVNWSIDVNLAQEKISNLALEDTISDNQAYIEESIKVYNAKQNAEGKISKTDLVPASEYDLVVNDTDFILSWKNDVERAFVVEYSTLFFAKNAENVGNEYKITGDGITEEDADASAGYNVTIKQTSDGGAEGRAGYLLVHKIDATAGQVAQPLAGIQFELIDTSNDKVLKTVTTDKYGYADFGRLLFGEYKLHEVNPPAGYFGFEDQKITIDKAFQMGESDPIDYLVEFENYKQANSVELVKRDNQENRLADAEFTLYKADGTKIETKTSNEDGELAFVDLEIGEYYIQETKAPNGFELDNKQHAFEITAEQKEIIQLEVENKPSVTSIEVAKIWSDDEGETEKRPDYVTINLLQNGEFYEEYEIQEAADWKLTIDNLPAVDANGEEYTYTMTENAVLGYAPSYSDDGLTVTNTRQAERDITITKTWFDDNNREGNRPSEITVLLEREVFELTDDGYVGTGVIEEVDTYTITAEDDWVHTVEDLPVFNADGLPFSYEYKEINLADGYKTESRDADITNTRVGKTEIKGEKFWKDNNNIDNRPESITLHLTQNGDRIAEQVVKPNADGKWLYSFADLEKYDAQGLAYNYTISEDAVFGYQEMYWSTTPGIINIDNIRVGTTELSGSKIWIDGDNEENTRPESIQVQLLQNNEVLGEPQKVTEETNWQYEFPNLPSYDSEGVAYEYTIEELEVDGYKVSYEGNDIRNTLVGETEVSVTKEWKGQATGGVTVKLLENGEVIKAIILTADSDWTHTFEGLPKYDNSGRAIDYTVEEVNIAGYVSDITGDAENGFTLTNTRASKTEIAVTKAWLGAVGESATVHLLVNGDKVEGQSIELTSENDWRHTFTELNAFDANGEPIAYTIEEEALDGFTPKYDGDTETGFVITNVRTGEKSVAITKTWKDEDATNRPETIKVNLLANDVFVSEHDVRAENDWALTIDELPKYDENGEEIVYTISEQDVPGYESIVDGFDITNTRVDEKTINITKAWLDNEAESRPESIEVDLFRSVADGEKESVGRYDVSAVNDWTLTISDLPSFDSDGKAYSYEVEEKAVEGYESTVNGFDITNKRVGKRAVDVTKTWQGEAAESATIELVVNDKTVDTVVLTKDNEWKHTFAELDQYDQQGKEIKYLVKELAIEGYQTKITGNADEGFMVTNTRVGTTVIAGTKTWDDKGAEDKRPKSITITVLQNGEEYDTVTVTPKSNWTYTVPNLPAYDENGKAYEYTIVEDDVEGYKSTVDGFDLTNTLKTYALGNYVWVDRDKDGIQDENEEVLEGVKVELFDENGDKISETETDENGRYIFDELPAGKYKVKFTLTEEQAKKYKFTKQNTADDVRNDSDADEDGWTREITLDDGNEQLRKEYEDQAFNATEGIDPTWDAGVIEMVNISVEKVWIDNNNVEEARPEKITVTLFANEGEVETVELSEENNWTYNFNGLDKYDANGEEISYMVTEKDVEGYKGEVEETEHGFVITNTKTSPMLPLDPVTKVDVEKVWKGQAQEAVTIHLLADGEKVETVELSEENNWKHTFNSLPLVNGDMDKEIVYTVAEIEIDGYDVSYRGNAIDGFTVINTQIEDSEKEDPTTETEDPEEPEKPAEENSTDKEGNGNTLPKTATNIFNLLALGLGILVIGSIVLFVARRKQRN